MGQGGKKNRPLPSNRCGQPQTFVQMSCSEEKMAKLFKFPIVRVIRPLANTELENSTHHHMRESAPGARTNRMKQMSLVSLFSHMTVNHLHSIIRYTLALFR